MKKKMLSIFIFLSFLISIVNGFKEIVILKRIDSSKVLITHCYSLFNSKCIFGTYINEKVIPSDFLFKTLEYSLLTPGGYSEDMLANILSYKKPFDVTEITQERDRKIYQYKINLKRLDFLQSSTSLIPSLKSEKQLLEEIFGLNNRVSLYFEKIRSIPNLSLTFSNQDNVLFFYSIAINFLENYAPPTSFAEIPAGSFLMGLSNKPKEANEVVHKVVISKKFNIAKFESSQFEWFSIMGYNPSFFSKKNYCPKNFKIINGVSLCPNHPIETVSIDEVNLYIWRLNMLDKKYNYRLPTEAEWEYASRGNSQSTYFFGEDFAELKSYAWFFKNSNLQSHERGGKKPNQFGLFDTMGNVFEWTSDYYSTFTGSGRIDPAVEKVSNWKVTKGGSWYAMPSGLRPAFRCKDEKNFRYSRIGFRLIREDKI
jgi:formylglycine-generating enzyme required for sulfatase activity